MVLDSFNFINSPLLIAGSIETANDLILQLKAYRNIYLCGRLAEYKYYNMDAVILKAFEVSKDIFKNH